MATLIKTLAYDKTARFGFRVTDPAAAVPSFNLPSLEGGERGFLGADGRWGGDPD